LGEDTAAPAAEKLDAEATGGAAAGVGEDAADETGAAAADELLGLLLPLAGDELAPEEETISASC